MFVPETCTETHFANVGLYQVLTFLTGFHEEQAHSGYKVMVTNYNRIACR